jgi:glycogen synthase
MKAVLLSREFSDGEGVSEYCKTIAESLVERGHQAGVVAFEDGSHYSVDDRVEVARVPLHFEGDNIFTWAMMLNNEIKGVVNRCENVDEIDVIHANDWATVPGGITLANHLEVPLVVTIHSTENERGFEGEHAGMISEMEWKAGFEADRVLATNGGTENSLKFDLDVPAEKLETVDPLGDGWTERVIEIYTELAKTGKKAEAVVS